MKNSRFELREGEEEDSLNQSASLGALHSTDDPSQFSRSHPNATNNDTINKLSPIFTTSKSVLLDTVAKDRA